MQLTASHFTRKAARLLSTEEFTADLRCSLHDDHAMTTAEQRCALSEYDLGTSPEVDL